jgi:hypothetical protein
VAWGQESRASEKMDTAVKRQNRVFMVHPPDSTGKCNTAAFGKNLSGGFITQALHRRCINLAYNFIYLFLCRQAPIVFFGEISSQYSVAVFYAPDISKMDGPA